MMISWIASYPKSGNTWVRRIVSLAVNGDKNIDQLRYDIPSFADICHHSDDNNQPISDHDIIKLWQMVQSDIVKNAGGVRTILKTHNIAASMDGIIFPDLSLIGNSIYIIRDPRDIVVSWSKHSNKSLGEAEVDLLNESFAIDKKTTTSLPSRAIAIATMKVTPHQLFFWVCAAKPDSMSDFNDLPWLFIQ